LDAEDAQNAGHAATTKSDSDLLKTSFSLFVFFCVFSVPLRRQRPMQTFPTS
jgi:hypothetical protein